MTKQSKSGINELLDEFGLKKTRMRQIVLNHFLQSRKPATIWEIEDASSIKCLGGMLADYCLCKICKNATHEDMRC